jgi:hypothetical protein
MLQITARRSRVKHWAARHPDTPVEPACRGPCWLAQSHRRLGIDNIVPMIGMETDGVGEDRNDCVRKFRRAWDRFSANRRWRRYSPNGEKSVSRADDARSSVARPPDQTVLVGRKAVDEDLA